ncbi:thioredoxin-disulfide reductase [Arcanobacterium urinimassiliense]|uniref:thioredoxin-disulfide reductase n=1 Tax=Arcanobacterium urinimassiliense TaxID=1871014 RepID=UPI00093F7FDF|nr:thioredoxin-disulfide reductase [Arcanobacterium urinimassiliense]
MADIYDVLIVGSGPAGWTAAIYSARAGHSTLVIAGALDAGGALMTTTEVENFPGWENGVMGPELMDNMEKQAKKFGAEVEYEDASEFSLSGDVKTIKTESASYKAKTVILALGSAYRKLGLENEANLTGKGVSYCATCDGFFFKDREIAVIGGGDSAVTEALFLAKFAKKVHVIHRRDALRASQIMADRLLAKDEVEMHWNSVVEKINGEDALESLTLKDTQTGELSELKVAGLFIAIGHEPRSKVVANEITTDEKGYIKVEHPTTKTNLPGVFACGDVVDSHYRQAVTAAGSGCKAALDAENYLADAAAK